MTPAIAPPDPATEPLLTAEQYLALPDDGRHTELVRGRIVEMPPANFRHGLICNKLARIIGNYVEERKLGWVVSNDAGVITRREPDSVRGPDVAFFSYSRIAADQIPTGYPAVAPELVFEVRSPSERWPAVMAKAVEYLNAGVQVVAVLDPDSTTIVVCSQNDSPRRLTGDEDLTLLEVFPEFRVPVRQFFE